MYSLIVPGELLQAYGIPAFGSALVIIPAGLSLEDLLGCVDPLLELLNEVKGEGISPWAVNAKSKRFDSEIKG